MFRYLPRHARISNSFVGITILRQYARSLAKQRLFNPPYINTRRTPSPNELKTPKRPLPSKNREAHQVYSARNLHLPELPTSKRVFIITSAFARLY